MKVWRSDTSSNRRRVLLMTFRLASWLFAAMFGTSKSMAQIKWTASRSSRLMCMWYGICLLLSNRSCTNHYLQILNIYLVFSRAFFSMTRAFTSFSHKREIESKSLSHLCFVFLGWRKKSCNFCFIDSLSQSQSNTNQTNYNMFCLSYMINGAKGPVYYSEQVVLCLTCIGLGLRQTINETKIATFFFSNPKRQSKGGTVICSQSLVCVKRT